VSTATVQLSSSPPPSAGGGAAPPRQVFGLTADVADLSVGMGPLILRDSLDHDVLSVTRAHQGDDAAARGVYSSALVFELAVIAGRAGPGSGNAPASDCGQLAIPGKPWLRPRNRPVAAIVRHSGYSPPVGGERTHAGCRSRSGTWASRARGLRYKLGILQSGTWGPRAHTLAAWAKRNTSTNPSVSPHLLQEGR